LNYSYAFFADIYETTGLFKKDDPVVVPISLINTKRRNLPFLNIKHPPIIEPGMPCVMKNFVHDADHIKDFYFCGLIYEDINILSL